MFVNCKEAPNSMEKMKNIAIFGVLNSVKALNPKESTNDFFSGLLLISHLGSVKA